LAYWSYNSALHRPTVSPLMVPGTYDVYYCHNCATSGAPIAPERSEERRVGKGRRTRRSALVVGGDSQHITVDIPATTNSATITLGGQPLPTTDVYGIEVDL